MNIWLLTPAHERYEVTELVLKQRVELRDALAPEITLNCVVVCDDDNGFMAQELGFHTVNYPNVYNGKKWNAGAQFAYWEGADYIINADSDVLISQDWFRAVDWDNPVVHSGHWYAAAQPERLTSFWCENQFGLGPVSIPRRMFASWEGRIYNDDEAILLLHHLCNRLGSRFDLDIDFVDVHDLQYVGIYRPGQEQVTPVQRYHDRWGAHREYALDRLSEDFPNVHGQLQRLYGLGEMVGQE